MNPLPLPADFRELLFFAVDTLRVRGVHYQVVSLFILVGIAFLLYRRAVGNTNAGLRLFTKVADNSWLSAAFLLTFSFTVFCLPTLVTGRTIPPISADEYGYLLTADTFRHGRLSNPPHPLWRHFENFYVLHQPSYNSKYFPGQAVALAAGWTVFGHPIYGVRLSGALACLAILWMLRAWFDKRWALFGALTGATSFVVFDWNQTYLGGNVALLGGALCLGAVPRLMKAPRVSSAVVLGLGFSLLSNSRPFEGLFFSLFLVVFLSFWIVKEGRHRFGAGAIATRIVVPLAVVMALDFGWIAAYNRAVTGNVFTTPYTLYLKQYEVTPIILFQKPSIPLAPTCVMKDYNDTTLKKYLSFQTPGGLATVEVHRLATIILTLISVSCLPFFMLGLYRLKPAGERWIPFLILASLTGSLLTFGFLPQYLAHVTPAILIVTVAGIRALHTSPRSSQFLRLVAVLTPAGQLMAILLLVGRQAVAPSLAKSLREDVENGLKSLPGNHLVVVRESCSADNWGYVYNEAQIDSAKIVWARELSANENQTLRDYYKDRRSWLLAIQEGQPMLGPWTP